MFVPAVLGVFQVFAPISVPSRKTFLEFSNRLLTTVFAWARFM